MTQSEASISGANPLRGWLVEARGRAERLVPGPIDPRIWRYLPWGHRLIVLRDRAPDVTPGGIIVPDKHQELPCEGWVLNVGPDVGKDHPKFAHVSPFPRPLDLVGLKVVFGQWSGSPVALDEFMDPQRSRYWMMTDGDIWCLCMGEEEEDGTSGKGNDA